MEDMFKCVHHVAFMTGGVYRTASKARWPRFYKGHTAYQAITEFMPRADKSCDRYSYEWECWHLPVPMEEDYTIGLDGPQVAGARLVCRFVIGGKVKP